MPGWGRLPVGCWAWQEHQGCEPCHWGSTQPRAAPPSGPFSQGLRRPGPGAPAHRTPSDFRVEKIIQRRDNCSFKNTDLLWVRWRPILCLLHWEGAESSQRDSGKLLGGRLGGGLDSEWVGDSSPLTLEARAVCLRSLERWSFLQKQPPPPGVRGGGGEKQDDELILRWGWRVDNQPGGVWSVPEGWQRPPAATGGVDRGAGRGRPCSN